MGRADSRHDEPVIKPRRYYDGFRDRKDIGRLAQPRDRGNV